MESTEPHLPDNIGLLLWALSEDPHLYRWFCSLRRLPAAERNLEIGTLARKYHATGDEAKVVDAFAHLTRGDNYEIAYQAITELLEEERQQT